MKIQLNAKYFWSFKTRTYIFKIAPDILVCFFQCK